MHPTPQITEIPELLTPQLLRMARSRLFDPLITWGYYPPWQCHDLRSYDWYQLTHVVYDADTELCASFDVCQMILAQALDRTQRSLRNLFKIRIVNSLPGELLDTRPHIDLPGPHQTAVFFPDDCDGVTEIYQQRSWMNDWEMPQELTVAREIQPRANTWFEFDGTHWRTTGRPVRSQQRICVVFNFIADPLRPDQE